jgi:GAF domain-containing protein
MPGETQRAISDDRPAARLTALTRLASATAMFDDLGTLLAFALETAAECLDLDSGLAQLTDRHSGRLQTAAQFGAPAALPLFNLQAQHIAQSGAAVYLEQGAPETGALAGVPIPGGATGVLGVLLLAGAAPRPFAAADRELLGAIAQHVGTAIENHLLREQLHAERSRSALMREAQQIMGGELDLGEIVRVTLALSRRMGAESAMLLLLEDGQLVQVASSRHDHAALDSATLIEIGQVMLSRDEVATVIETLSPVAVNPLGAERRAAAGQDAENSALYVPIEGTGGALHGVLVFFHSRPDGLAESHMTAALFLASQLSGALERLQQRQSARRRRDQMQIIEEIGRDITSILDLRELLVVVARRIAVLFGYYHANIAVVEGEQYVLYDPYGPNSLAADGDGDLAREAMHVAMETGLIGYAIRTGSTHVANDVRREPHYHWSEHLPDTRAELDIPLRLHNRIVGVLDVQSVDLNAFNPELVEMMEGLATPLAIAVENARLYAAEQQRRRQAEVLREVSQIVGSSLSLKDVLQRIIEQLQVVIGFDSASVQLLRGQALEIIAARGPQAQSWIGMTFELTEDYPNYRVITERRAIPIGDTTGYASFAAYPHIRSWLGVPLILQERVTGMITLDSSRLNFYHEDDAQLALAFASQAAIAIENARLYEQAERERRQLAEARGLLQTGMADLAQRNVELLALAELASAIGADLDLNHVLETVVVGIAEAMDARICGVMMPDETGLLHIRASHGLPPGYVANWHTGPGGSRHWQVYTTGEAMVLNNLVEAPSPVNEHRLLAESANIRKAILAPLAAGGRILGVMTVAEKHSQADFTEADVRLLGTFANQAAVAIDNARLYAAEQQRRHQAEVLREVAEAVSSTLQIDELLVLILEQLQKVVTFDTASILMLDGREMVISGGRGFDRLERVLGMRFPADDPRFPNYEVLRRRAPYIVPDVAAAYDVFHSAPHNRIRAWMGVPLIFGEQLFGMLALDSYHKDAYTPEHAELALAFANQAAAAIQNARLFEETRRRARQLATLNEIGRAVSARLALDDVLERVYDRTVHVLPADSFFIALYNAEDNTLAFELMYDRGQRFPREVLKVVPGGRVHRVLTERSSLRILRTPEETEERRTEARAQRGAGMLGDMDEPSASLIYVPLVHGNQAIGAMSIQSYTPNVYTTEHEELLNAIANQVAIAIENARLYEQARFRIEVLTQLYNLITVVRSTLDLDEVLQATVQSIQRLLKVPGCAIGLIDYARRTLTYQAALGARRRAIPELALDQIAPELLEPLLAGQVTMITRVGDYPELMSVYRMRASRGVAEIPIVAQGTTRGVISLLTPGPPRFSPEQIELLAALADQVAVAIVNAQRFAELQAALVEREQTQERLIRSESLAAVGQLVAGVAHELNNPLASVSSLVQSSLESLAESPLPEPDQLDDAQVHARLAQRRELEWQIVDDLEFSRKEIRRAKEIVGSLLDLSRQSQDYTEQVNLNVVLQDTLRILYNKYKHLDVEIVQQLDPNLLSINGNFAQLGQVALNIVQNALEALPDGRGRIEIGTGWDAERERVYWYCQDNGAGIPPEVLPNIFNPFFTTKEVGKGTGLGLYISHEIVKRHNGEIVVTTEPGAGTTFRIELPL